MKTLLVTLLLLTVIALVGVGAESKIIRDQHDDILLLQYQVSGLETRIGALATNQKTQSTNIIKLYKNEKTLGSMLYEIIEALSGPGDDAKPSRYDQTQTHADDVPRVF